MTWTDWDPNQGLVLWDKSRGMYVKDTDRVYVRYRDGTESLIRVVGDLRWDHQNCADDIVAFRISHTLQEAEEHTHVKTMPHHKDETND